jgi:hypothetical protein
MGGRPSRSVSNNGRISLSDTIMPLMSFRAAAGASAVNPPDAIKPADGASAQGGWTLGTNFCYLP